MTGQGKATVTDLIDLLSPPLQGIWKDLGARPLRLRRYPLSLSTLYAYDLASDMEIGVAVDVIDG